MFKSFVKVSVLLMVVALIAVGCGKSASNESNNNAAASADNTATAADAQTDSPAASPESEGYAPTELTVQFVPSQNAETLEAKAKPLEKLLSDQLGIPVKVSVSTDYNTIIEAMQSKKVDVGFLPPNTYVVAKDMGAAEVILQAQRYGVNEADGTPTDELVDYYKAMFVVKADSGIKELKDLKGKRIAWQGVTSTAGYVYPAVELYKAGVDPNKDVESIEVHGHDKGILAVLNGDADAAAVFQDARNIVKKDFPNVFKQVVPMHFTANIPNDTISVRSDMSKEWQKKLQDAFIAIGKDETPGGGRSIIREIYSHEGYVVSEDKNFDTVREYSKGLPQ